MVSVVIGIGSNCGNRKLNVERAISWLGTILIEAKSSEIYETPCALKVGKPYMNSVVKGFYSGTGIQLENNLKEKEREMGRDSECREKGDVPIDMDIVVMDGGVIKNWDYRQKFFQIGFQQISF